MRVSIRHSNELFGLCASLVNINLQSGMTKTATEEMDEELGLRQQTHVRGQQDVGTASTSNYVSLLAVCVQWDYQQHESNLNIVNVARRL